MRMFKPLETFDNVNKRIKRIAEHKMTHAKVTMPQKSNKEKELKYHENTINDFNEKFITDINDVDTIQKDQLKYKKKLEKNLMQVSSLESPNNTVYSMNIGPETENIVEKTTLFVDDPIKVNFEDGFEFSTLMWLFLAVLGSFIVVLCLIGSLLAFFLYFGDHQFFKKKQTNKNIILEDFELQTY